LPNPGLIEGVAVATAPDDDELTDVQWARAMLDLGILPEAKSLFSLAFVGQNADKSYTVAGAFVRWVTERWGTAVVRAWYGGASLETLSGESWSGLQDGFRAWLGSVAMPAAAREYAQARFDRPSVWGRTCPHVVDALDREADQCREEHRFARARNLYASALARDPHDWHARLDQARIDMHYGDARAGKDALARIVADEHASAIWRDRAAEALADDELRHGNVAAAIDAYGAIAGRTTDEDSARTLEIKAIGAADPEARRAVLDLLVGDPGHPTDLWLGAFSLGTWTGETNAPLAAYLSGKNLARRDEWERAAAWLDFALDAPFATPRIGREVLRQRAAAACALRDSRGLWRVHDIASAETSPFEGSAGGRRAWLLSFVERCESELAPGQ
jgi:hypothetical protein